MPNGFNSDCRVISDGATRRTLFRAMGGTCEIVVSGEDEPRASRIAEAAIAEVRRIETKFSRYRADSVVGRINAVAGSGNPCPCDEETGWLLNYADYLFRLSGGLFDITSGVLRRAWNFESKRLPEAGEVARLRELVGWNKVERTADGIRLKEAGMEIDFGGFGKEYAADCAGAAMRAHGAKHGYANLGGDIHVVGPQADGSPWLVGIQDPRRELEIVATIPLENGALATSGDYERYFEENGKRYCHVLNPLTGHPVSHWRSVSVQADLALKAGSLSTVTMLKEAAGIEFLAASRCDYFCIDHEGHAFIMEPGTTD